MGDMHPETTLADVTWLTALARSLVQSEPDADDLVQETWLAAQRSPPDMPNHRAWLARVLRRFHLRHLRTDRRRTRREQVAHQAASSPSPSTAELVERAELRRKLSECLIALDEPYRTTLMLVAFEGQTPAQIAVRDGISAAHVRRRLRKARELYRHKLERDYGGDWGKWSAALLPFARLPLPSESPVEPLSQAPLLPATLTALMSLKALLVAAAAVAAGLWFWFGGDGATPLPNGSSGRVDRSPVAERAANPSGVAAAGSQGMAREAVSPGAGPAEADPAIRAALCGFRGRVVDHAGAPVAGCGVRLYRGAMDTLLRGKVDLFEPVEAFEPDFAVAEVRTGEDGTFEVLGVWPRAIFLLYAGIGTDAPTHQLVTKVPSPGEVADLGDIVLEDAGVIVGTVCDEDGEPVADALVRAADLPGTLAAFFPAERFDPEGAVLVRQPGWPVEVLSMPPWVKRVFAQLPIPTTYTAADGSFRLVGVVPGSNLLATTSSGFLSNMKPSVQVRSGEVKDVGRIRLRIGEELYARVLDERGEPVVGAEVVAGSTLSMVPCDLGRVIGKTNAMGEVGGTGFAPGKVTVAARRSPSHAWVLAEPQRIFGDVLITLPAEVGVTVTVQAADGSVVPDPSLRLLRGFAGEGAAELVMLGFTRPVSLADRLTKREDGRLQIQGLSRGRYTLLAEVRGRSVGSTEFELGNEDAAVVVELATPQQFVVRVVDQDNRPLRSCMITATSSDPNGIALPVECGRTDPDGKLMIDRFDAEKLFVSAEHPQYGVVHGETDGSTELVLQLIQPGSIQGVLTENGRAPAGGRFSVLVLPRENKGVPGPVTEMLQIVAVDREGKFTASGLQPGLYFISVGDTLDVVRSPGSSMKYLETMFLNERRGDGHAWVASGEVAEVDLDVAVQPVEGPTAQVFGSVLVNGRAAKDCFVEARGSEQRFTAKTDERGRFLLDAVPAGWLRVEVHAAELGVPIASKQTLWGQDVQLQVSESRELVIDVRTSSISGVCYLPNGQPAANVRVQATGRPAGANETSRGVRSFAFSDARGRWSLDNVPEGRWKVDFSCQIDDRQFRVDGLPVELSSALPQAGLRVDLTAMLRVRGRLDVSVLPEDHRTGALLIEADGEHGGSHWQRVRGECTFISHGLEPGAYRVQFQADGEGQPYSCGRIEVPSGGLDNVILVPQVR